MKRWLAAIFLLGFILSLAALSAESASEEERLKAIQLQLEERKLQLRKTKEEQQAVLGRLAVINKDLKLTSQKLNLAHNKITLNEGQIYQLGSELKLSEGNLQAKEGKFKARLAEMYKGGTINYLELLVASKSMSDFLNRLYFFGKVIGVDANLVQGIRADVQTVKVKKGALEVRTEEIRGLAKVIAEKKEQVSSLAQEKKGIYDKLKERREEYERQIAELEKSSNELEALILKKTARKGGKAYGSGRMIWPLHGRLTSPFGWRRSPWGGRSQMHTGQDIAAAYGSPIAAADAGEVIFAGWWDGYGKAIVVDHGKGITTVYGHLSRIYKQVGDVVAKGQTIGLEGSTGYSTGPHLHFEVRVRGKPVNPLGYLN
jgi:murein DD-endopeptidase MepM/ murein hydrolase activator NlpD